MMGSIAADIYISDAEAESVMGNLYRIPETGMYKIELVLWYLGSDELLIEI